ncbi:hypothetical protein Taro_019952 [Colocasia esculenta]|uniref:J domain-containing protein n=1 Tax=Colocasia esculenta TaxID=4460 RepID=A0A843UV44_COLES|nr:hypothetical protein [Colocasia esculenta]
MLAMETRAGAGAGGMEALRLLGMAEQLLGARDLPRSRAFAERAMEADPLLDGPERVLAAADVLLAAERRRVNNHVDWYAVLQLDGPAAAVSALRLQYRRLALLLRPEPRAGGLNLFSSSSFSYSAAVADEAFKLVCDAWAVLSDPAKKGLYDKEIEIAAAASKQGSDGRGGGGQNSGEGAGEKASVEAEIDGGPPFWTACTSCCYVYQYVRGYDGRTLLCQNCRKAFQATELACAPSVVPGMDMYFCSWGLFPLGFPGGPNFTWPTVPTSANGQRVRGVRWRKKLSSDSSDSSDVDEDWNPKSARKKQNRKSSASRNGMVNGKVISGNNVGYETTGTPSASQRPLRKTRAKVMAKGDTSQAACFDDGGVVASGEAEVDAEHANEDNGEARQGAETRADGKKNPQRPGCSRAVEESVEDLNLNFTVDINAAAAIIESMAPFVTVNSGIKLTILGYKMVMYELSPTGEARLTAAYSDAADASGGERLSG